jgi:hypothetical protein
MTADEGPELKRGVLRIRRGVPLAIEASTTDVGADDITPEDSAKIDRVSKTLKVYLSASRNLVAGRYAELRDYVPEHMTSACRPSAFLLDDGIIVRYDLVDNPELVVSAYRLHGSITDWAPRLSEDVVHCPRDAASFDPGEKGLTISWSKRTPDGAITPVTAIRIAIVAAIGEAQSQRHAGARPTPIASVTNEFEAVLVGETVPSGGRREQQFLVRNRLRAPVGWRTIEVYPEFNPDIWNPDIASLWAEADLLAAVARRNLQEQHYAGLDPHVDARKLMLELLRQLEAHLNGPEEPLHQFIRQHPQLLSPVHTHVWSKLPLGSRVTDFVFKEPPTDYLLVELEKASHRLFREDGQQKQELVHAIDQVLDWRRYIEDHLSYVQRELGLQGISSSPRALIVIGRRASLTPENQRKLVTIENATPRLRILTYDDVLTTARSAAENMLGPLWLPGDGVRVYFLTPK